MIFIMSYKQWKKNAKKLVIPKEYLIFDGTEDEGGAMDKYTNNVTMDAFNPPIKLVKLMSKSSFYDDGDVIDMDKLQVLEKKFFNGVRLKNACLATISGLIENGNINIFIIMRNKAFKIYKKRLKKTFMKLFPVDFEFIEIFSGDAKDHKNSLRRNLSTNEIIELRTHLSKREKEMERDFTKKKKKFK